MVAKRKFYSNEQYRFFDEKGVKIQRNQGRQQKIEEIITKSTLKCIES
jgi:hypothetical protein